MTRQPTSKPPAAGVPAPEPPRRLPAEVSDFNESDAAERRFYYTGMLAFLSRFRPPDEVAPQPGGGTDSYARMHGDRRVAASNAD